MKRLADRFGEAASNCTSMLQLRDLIFETSGELRFDYFALLHHSSLTGGSPSCVRIDNYPPDWVTEMIDSGLVARDPVHLACRRASRAFRWAEIDRLIPLRREQVAILERSRRFGLGEGLTIPVNVPGEPAGSCSFAVRAGDRLPDDRLPCAELIGAHAFEAARRIAGLPASTRPRLSRREVQCLRLVAAGKTDWEIAIILEISVETARQYVKRARSAYDAVTRTQLVVFGLRDDWISFDEALDARR